MPTPRRLTLVLLFLALAALACSGLTPTGAPTPAAATATEPANAAPSAAANTAAGPAPSSTARAQAASATPPAEPSATQGPSLTPQSSAAPLDLEVVQSQTWTDADGNARINVLVRNPYDYPVQPAYGAHATLLDSAGASLKDGELYFLDGLSGGGGFILPGETIAANACFTCEKALLTEAWSSVEFLFNIVDATGQFEYSTDVEPAVSSVEMDAGSPIFWFTGSVKNNSSTALQRISVRVVVFDQDGQLVGAAEASAWDVGPGVVGDVHSYGLGQKPEGPVTYEVTAVGVNY
jgi:hypothetical protein